MGQFDRMVAIWLTGWLMLMLAPATDSRYLIWLGLAYQGPFTLVFALGFVMRHLGRWEDD